MAIIALKAWYVPEYEPVRSLTARPHDLRLAKNSLLKAALRADFLDEVSVVKDSLWFQKYMAGEKIEFYIEGSGSYSIANIDLISQEIYFSKQDSLVNLEPYIFLSYQTQQPESSQLIQEALTTVLADLNGQSRLKLSLEQSHRPTAAPLKLNSALLAKLKRSLLFVADVSAIAELATEPPLVIPSPHVCVEVGYALQVKRLEQILLIDMTNGASLFPFDLDIQHRLSATGYSELVEKCCQQIMTRLEPFQILKSIM